MVCDNAIHVNGVETGEQARSQVRKRGGSGKKKCGPTVGVGHQKGEGAGGGSAPSRASRGSF